MTTINRSPTGWLGFLGIKNFGRNPRITSEVLAPTWDLTELYYAANRTYIFGSALVLNALGNFVAPATQVPAGQIWAVHWFSVNTETLAAGNAIDMQPIVFNNPAGASVILPGGPRFAPVVGGRAIAAIEEPLVLQPGESLGVYVNQFAGLPINSFPNCCYTRLDA